MKRYIEEVLRKSKVCQRQKPMTPENYDAILYPVQINFVKRVEYLLNNTKDAFDMV